MSGPENILEMWPIGCQVLRIIAIRWRCVASICPKGLAVRIESSPSESINENGLDIMNIESQWESSFCLFTFAFYFTQSWGTLGQTLGQISANRSFDCFGRWFDYYLTVMVGDDLTKSIGTLQGGSFKVIYQSESTILGFYTLGSLPHFLLPPTRVVRLRGTHLYECEM